MFRVLFLLFVIIPIIEIMVLMKVGSWLGAWPTIFIVIITAWLGAKNVRQQGIVTMNSVQTKLAQGQMPSDEIVSGLMLLIAGVLLVTPGFVTDVFGLSLLVPQVRKIIVKVVQKQLVTSKGNGTHFNFQANQYSNAQQSSFTDNIEQEQGYRKGQTLDGEYERKD